MILDNHHYTVRKLMREVGWLQRWRKNGSKPLPKTFCFIAALIYVWMLPYFRIWPYLARSEVLTAVLLNTKFRGVSMDRAFFIFTVKQSKTQRHIPEDLSLQSYRHIMNLFCYMISARAELWWNARALHVGRKRSQLFWSVRGKEIFRRILLLLQLPRIGRIKNVSCQIMQRASRDWPHRKHLQCASATHSSLGKMYRIL
jgi:hypothetical protein